MWIIYLLRKFAENCLSWFWYLSFCILNFLFFTLLLFLFASLFVFVYMFRFCDHWTCCKRVRRFVAPYCIKCWMYSIKTIDNAHWLFDFEEVTACLKRKKNWGMQIHNDGLKSEYTVYLFYVFLYCLYCQYLLMVWQHIHYNYIIHLYCQKLRYQCE